MRKQQKKILLSAVVAVAAAALIAGILFLGGLLPGREKEEPVVKDRLWEDTAKKTVRYEGNRYRVCIGYDKKAAVEVLEVDGTALLDPEKGIYTAYQAAGDGEGRSFSSLSLPEDPAVTVDGEGRTVTLVYEDEYTRHELTFQFSPEQMEVWLERTVLRDVKMRDQSFPAVTLAQDAAESIRWEKSGANFWVGGRASEQKNFLAAGTGYRKEKESEIWLGNVRRAMKDLSFTVLTGGESRTAVCFRGTLRADDAKTEAATQVQRVDEGTGTLPLELCVTVSNGKRLYCTGSPDGWGSYTGRVVSQGETVFRDVSFSSGDVSRVAFTVAPADYDAYYDLGTLKGVDEETLSKILNDFSRMMILDADMGTAVENMNHFLELPALEQHWIANLIGILRDDAAIETEKNCLRNIMKNLQAKDGHITSPYPDSRGDGWGWNYSDSMPAYVIAIIETYLLSGDRAFLDEMRESAERALAAQESMYISGGVYLCRNLATGDSVGMNDYWEHNAGEFNGYTTPIYYQALCRFAEVEREIYGENAKAEAYEALAARIRKDYNERMWSEETGSFLYGDGSHDIVHLPTQAAVLSSGIADGDRNKRLIAAVERATAVYDLSYHVMNLVDLKTGDKPADQSNDPALSMAGMNGGWYGAPDGEFYAAFPLYGDRTLIPRYVNGLAEQFSLTGFVNATCYKRDGVSPGDYGWWDMMPTMAYPIWGLYRYGYGFRPSLDGLHLEPFLDPSMIGSVVLYRWRGQDMSVTYNGLYDFTVDCPVQETDLYVSFLRQTPGARYQVEIGGRTAEVLADEIGRVTVKLDRAGKTNVKLLLPDPEEKPASGTNVALGRPVAPSSTFNADTSLLRWSDCLTDGKKDRFWQPENSAEEAPWIRLSLGQAYDLGGITLSFAEAARFGYKIEGSNDPLLVDWKTVTEKSGETVSAEKGGSVSLALQAPVNYSYLRITFYPVSAADKICLSEIEATVQ